MSDIVNKLWGFCHTLRHDGVNYTDYLEQVTLLLFLKMAEEKDITLPKHCDWAALANKNGSELLDHFTDTLRKLGKQPGILGDIFSEAQNRISKPVNLKRLITLIDEHDWSSMGVDVKAHAYEGLLEKAASEGKKGAGQLFTPRPLIDAIVQCMKPDPRAHSEFTVCDPACGTGGFLISAREWMKNEAKGILPSAVAQRVKRGTYFGQEIDQRPRRLALMNGYLHSIELAVQFGDSIYDPPGSQKFDCVLTNPPFGVKGASEPPARDDFTITTKNKQLNFLQHIITITKPGGRVAVVLPDNCLFADAAGEVMEILSRTCRLHTVLRLPRGTFTPYSQGVKANVLFFIKGYPTSEVWIYDARTNVPGITKKDRPLTPAHFADFVKVYGSDPHGQAKRKPSDAKEDRWHSFDLAAIKERDFKLDSMKWLKEENPDEDEELGDPVDMAKEALAELAAAEKDITAILALLGEEVSDTKTAKGKQ